MSSNPLLEQYLLIIQRKVMNDEIVHCPPFLKIHKNPKVVLIGRILSHILFLRTDWFCVLDKGITSVKLQTCKHVLNVTISEILKNDTIPIPKVRR